MSRKQQTTKRNQRNQKKQAERISKEREQNDARKLRAYLEKENALPITIRLNHQALGMNENTICEACRRGDHWDCNMATWCQCDDDCDGQSDCYDTYDDLP